MRKIILCTFAFWLCFAAGLQAQTTGVLTGTVRDSSGGVVPGTEVVALQQSTNTRFATFSNDVGDYMIPNIAAGTYTIVVETPGFKKAVIQQVKVAVGSTTTQHIILQIGEVSEQVIVEAAQGLVERQTATVSSVIEGRQITELPFTSRDALDLTMMQAGTTTPGRPRSSSVNALPKAAIAITIDGIRVQDNYLMSSDGFFAYIRPRIDAVEEYSLTTAGQTSDSAGESAVQIKFVTKRGTNEWHGGAWWYHRNPVLNANYYFNNLAGTPRERQLLNQAGFKVGGPILRDKLFFFFTIDSFRLPSSISRTRTLLTDDAFKGKFTYNTTSGQRTVDLLALAAAGGFPNSIDSQHQALFDQMLSAAASPGVGALPSTSPITRQISFNNPAFGKRYFPTLRLDYNITDKWHWEGIWNYNYFNSFPDTLNSRDPRYPGFTQAGGQISNRFQLTTALRTSIGAKKVNEFRAGIVGGTVGFFPEITPDQYPKINIGGQPAGYYPSFSFVSNPLHSCCNQLRNAPLEQYMDNFSWTRGSHTFMLGTQVSVYHLWRSNLFGVLPSLSFGVTSNDPADTMFNLTNFPGADSGDLSSARALYAMLTGRVSGSSADIYASEKSREFELLEPNTTRVRQLEWGIFAQDSWRVNSALTLNYGLRWQLQTPYKITNDFYSTSTYDGLWGPSGPGNLFKPGTLTGGITEWNLLQGRPYDLDKNNFAPNLGIAWNPNLGNGVLARIFGTNPVFRGGYSISFTREGMAQALSMLGSNPGYSGTARLTADIDFASGSILARNGLPSFSLDPAKAFDFPIRSDSRFRGFNGNEFDKNLVTSYVQSWSLGIQRELNRSTVLEIRYVGNKGTKLWRQYDLDERNIFENGFLDEFRAAQSNLAISRSMGKGNNFSNQGLPGQVALPILQGIFGSPTSSLFRSGTYVSYLDTGAAGSLANSMDTNFTRFNNMLKAGLPINFFSINPWLSGVFYLGNGGWSTYNALQVEVRRRMTRGLLVQANYTWSHAMTNMNAVSSSVFSQARTLRDIDMGRGPSPFNIYHALKANWIYELPFGTGKRWAPGSSVLNKLAEGWGVSGILRVQSGRGFSLTGGRATFNQQDGGVDFNISRQAVQNALKVRHDPATGRVFWFPDNFIGSDGRSDPDVIAAHETAGSFGSLYYFTGPLFARADITLSKKTYVGEAVNVEFRAEFLNAFNNINFLFGGSASGAGNQSIGVRSTSFGRMTQAYRDTSTTNDLGGRMVQFVLRINF